VLGRGREGVNYGLEDGRQLRGEQNEDGDRGNRDQGEDQAILDHRLALFADAGACGTRHHLVEPVPELHSLAPPFNDEE